tara:strand:+ start:627 stop:1310 length:684 start_codon:yes stop_codon:yes gene_type:complete
METINVTVREGDSFDELYLAYQKPVGTSHDFTNSELSAQIRESFGATTVVDSFGVQKLDTTGHLKLSLTSAQTEALTRNVGLGYTERGLTYDVGRQAVDPSDVEAVFLWDLKELYYIPEGSGIASISSGTVIDSDLGQYRIRVTTSGRHNLASTDIVKIAGASVSGYNQTYTTNTVSIVSNTVFEIVPGSGGTPNYSSNASGGTLNVLKEDTVVLGTLQVIPRISAI